MALSAYCEGRVFGLRAGGSARVLALHGWGRDHKDWAVPLDGLRPGVLAIDLPGFGTSPPPEEAWGSREYAKALLPVLDAMVPPVVVVGHSFGGRVALQLADLAGPAVGGLVLSGVPLGPRRGGKPRLRFRMVKGLRRAGLVSEARMEAARKRYGSDDYRRAEGVIRAVLVRTVAESYDDVLSRLSCPVELVWGVDDTPAPVAGARHAASVLPHARLTEIPEGNHFAVFSQPDALRGAVDRILEDLPR